MKHRLARTSMHVDLSSQQRCLVLKLKRLPSRTANTGIRYCWFWSVCTNTLVVVSDGVEMKNSRVEGAPGSDSIGHSYLRSSMLLWLTMLSYFSTPSVVFTVTYVFYLLQLWRVDLILAKLAVQQLAPPYLCQVDFAVSGRPRLRSGAGQGRGDSRKSIRPSRGSGNELVGFKYSTADLTELGSGNEHVEFRYPKADPTERGLGK
ncbi:hypothetical protein BHM03_00056824 [Ensete ventricosum]|nr:hypothetical protein BHM03_00056824 [Ensete ventricosum]